LDYKLGGQMMDEHYIKTWSGLNNQMYKPLKQLLDLNIKTWQSFKFINAEELYELSSLPELFSKQMDAMIINCCKAVEYLEQTMLIMENSLMPVKKEMSKAVAFNRPTLMVDPIQAIQDITDSAFQAQGLNKTPAQTTLDVVRSIGDEKPAKKSKSATASKSKKMAKKTTKAASDKPKAKQASSLVAHKHNNERKTRQTGKHQKIH
jgi:hypothetical protein